jgi:hypothetical protein
MGTRLNTEFNYRTQVIGETPWEKIKTLKGFLNGRLRARALKEVAALKLRSKQKEIEHLISIGGLEHIILNLQAEMIETMSVQEDMAESFAVNEREIEFLEKYLAELYAIVEPTRLPGYDDDMMFEVNAENEFAESMAKEIQAEVICFGRASPANIRNAMRSPLAIKRLTKLKLIPEVPLIDSFRAEAITASPAGRSDTE